MGASMNERDEVLNAEGWDDRMADGNRFFRELIWPATKVLLSLREGDRVLDVACGNGVTARAMASLGAHVTAFDFSPSMIERARSRGVDRIDYSVADATSEQDLLAYESGYDCVHCGMALFDIADVGPFFEVMPRLLKAHGRLVFSLMHLCFNNPSIRFVGERYDDSGERYSMQVERYMSSYSQRGLSKVGLKPHLYFHRSLTDLLQQGFQAGLVISGFEERAFSAEGEPRSKPLSWGPTFSEIPAVVVMRMEPGRTL